MGPLHSSGAQQAAYERGNFNFQDIPPEEQPVLVGELSSLLVWFASLHDRCKWEPLKPPSEMVEENVYKLIAEGEWSRVRARLQNREYNPLTKDRRVLRIVMEHPTNTAWYKKQWNSLFSGVFHDFSRLETLEVIGPGTHRSMQLAWTALLEMVTHPWYLQYLKRLRLPVATIHSLPDTTKNILEGRGVTVSEPPVVELPHLSNVRRPMRNVRLNSRPQIYEFEKTETAGRDPRGSVLQI